MQLLQADLNKDGVISEEEYKEYSNCNAIIRDLHLDSTNQLNRFCCLLPLMLLKRLMLLAPPLHNQPSFYRQARPRRQLRVQGVPVHVAAAPTSLAPSSSMCSPVNVSPAVVSRLSHSIAHSMHHKGVACTLQLKEISRNVRIVITTRAFILPRVGYTSSRIKAPMCVFGANLWF